MQAQLLDMPKSPREEFTDSLAVLWEALKEKNLDPVRTIIGWLQPTLDERRDEDEWSKLEFRIYKWKQGVFMPSGAELWMLDKLSCRARITQFMASRCGQAGVAQANGSLIDELQEAGTLCGDLARLSQKRLSDLGRGELEAVGNKARMLYQRIEGEIARRDEGDVRGLYGGDGLEDIYPAVCLKTEPRR